MKKITYSFLIILLFALSNQTSSFAQNSHSNTDATKIQKNLIDSLIISIDDNYDILHSDYTPSVHKLSELGIPAIIAIIPLLSNAKQDTRLHAQRVFEGVIYRMNGFVSGQGFTINGGEEKSRIILKSIGYDWQNIDAAKMQTGINNLKKWVAENQK
jgi:hypothetical protein